MAEIISSISANLYTYVVIILLIAGGIYFTVRTKGVQAKTLPEQIRVVTEKPKDKKSVSSFHALMVSTASRVGTGNIVGVALALCVGGFGSVFWMWVIAIIGSASAFIESTLAQIYKKKGLLGCYGGPAYYIEKAIKSRKLAVVFSILLILTYGVGFNMLASYNLQLTFQAYVFYDPAFTPWIIGLIVAIVVGYCLFGGGSRIVKATSILVPIMGVAYILISLIVVILNITSLPAVIGRIFSEAFDFTAIFGGFSGSCVMHGIRRGLFSNEAGVGSAPNASASAEVSHPVKQGLVQVLSVFIDTLLVCTATAFMCMCSGVEPSGTDGTAYINLCMNTVFGGFGVVFITLAMVLFAFTTLIGNLYYVNQSFNHLLKREPSKKFNYVYYVVASLLILLGAGLNSSVLWDIADILMGLMTVINVPVIIILSGKAIRALNDYRRQKKAGLDPVFIAKNVGITEELDYWQEEKPVAKKGKRK